MKYKTEDIVQAYKEYGSQGKVAKVLGCDKTVVGYHLKKAGLGKRSLSKAEEMKIVEAYKETKSIEETQHITHFESGYIQFALNKYGIDRAFECRNKKIADETFIEECENLTLREIANKYGMHEESLRQRAKSLGVETKTFHRKCTVCGKEFDTKQRKVHRCSECARAGRVEGVRKWEDYVKERKEQAKQRANVKEVENKWYIATHTIQRECRYCGSLFYCLDSSNKKTCSKECSRRFANIKRDKRIPKEQIVDTDITLKKLFKRDKGKCWICGGTCDFNDIATSEKGYKYCGDAYPEIEHVIPISRGGLHSWDNVRLAHHKCNLIKGADLYPYVPLDYKFAYKEKAKGNPAKQTAQYTLDGELVKVWESTGQIHRELGYSDKRIQSVCRGEGKTAFGYRWKYI